MKRYLCLLAILPVLSASGRPVRAQSAPDASSPSKPVQDQGKKPPGNDVEILSDSEGVDFKPYIAKIVPILLHSWAPLVPDEVKSPSRKVGPVKIRFSILPSGLLEPKSMMLESRSGDVALDRSVWGAIQGSAFPPLPTEFKGPRLTLRFVFQYNPPKSPASPPDRP